MTVERDDVTRFPVHVITDYEFNPLPGQLTSLVGRQLVSERLANLMRRNNVRIVTLTGPGGIGKTRLAIDVAERLSADYPDGVAYVDIAPLVNSTLVLPTIAMALGVVPFGSRPLHDRLVQLLEHRRILLVIDNFEQVIEAASTVASVIAASAGVDCLVTSRQPLRIMGEREFPVPLLDLPAADEARPDILGANPAVRLFVERARAVDPDFVLTEANAADVVSICRQLDGIPLAIELAARRIKVFPLQHLLTRLVGGLDILSGGQADHPDRQQTMRATIAWSHDLLGPRQQAMFRALSIFAGGVPLEEAERAAERFLPAAEASGDTAIDVIASLIDASLVRVVTDTDGVPRLSVLHVIRQFGTDLLDASEDLYWARNWLVDWCLKLADMAQTGLTGRDSAIWHLRLHQDLDNIRAARSLLDPIHDGQTMLRLATAFGSLWSTLGHEREGYQWLNQALQSSSDLEPVLRIRAMNAAAGLSNSLGDLEGAATMARAGLALAVAQDDRRGMADLHCVLGNVARGLGNQDEARAHYHKALAGYRQLEDRYRQGYACIQLAKLGNLGTVGQPGDSGDLDRAVAYCNEALQIYRKLGNSWGIARGLHQLGYLCYKQRDYTRAARLSSEALAMFVGQGNLTEAASPIEDLADVAGVTGHGALAARMYGAAEVLRERQGVPMWPSYRDEYDQEVAIGRALLPDAVFRREWREGRNLPLDSVVAEAEGLARSLAAGTSAPQGAMASATTARTMGLTAREEDVLRLLAAGHSNQAIADALFISVTTVKGHVRSLMDKLDLRSRTALAAWAHQHDLT